jgi:hypothetical protein
MASVKFESPHLLGLQVVEGSLAIKEVLPAVNAYISQKKDISGIWIVLRVIAVNGNATIAYLDIVVGYRSPVLKAGITISCNLNGLVPEVPELGMSNPSQRENQDQNQK